MDQTPSDETGPGLPKAGELRPGGAGADPRDSALRLATLLSNLPGMAYRCRNDRDWTMEFASDGCEPLTGYKPADLIGNATHAYSSLIHPEDRDRIWNEVQDAVSRRIPFLLNYRIVSAGGQVKWVWEQGAGIFSGGRLEALEGFITDITERRLAEAKLLAGNERFERILENTDAGYFRIGMDGRYEDVNPAWLRMHGLTSKRDAVGQHYSFVQVPEDSPKAREVVATLSRGEPVKSGEFSRLRRDGTIGYHSFSANPVFEDGKVVAIEGFIVDITDRKIADRERRRTEQRYKALFDSMQEGVAIHRLVYREGLAENYRLLDVNRRFEELVGLKREHAVDRLATELYGTPEAPYLKEYAAVVRTGEPFLFETYFPPMDKHFVISAASMGGDLFATIFFDVTEQRRMQEHYKLISENTADVIWLWDLGASRCVYVSPSVTKLRGFLPEEVMEHTMEQAMPPHTHRAMMDELRRRTSALAAGDQLARTGTNEIEFYCKDGAAVPTETVTTILPDEHGVARHVIGVSRDIRERKRMEDALRRSDEKFVKAFLSSPAATFLTTPDDGDRLIDFNQAFEELIGYRREEAMGRSPFELHLLASTAEEAEIRRQLLETGRIENFEARIRRKNGELLTAILSALPIEIDGRRCGVGTVIDVSGRKRAEEVLRKSEEKFSKVFRSSPVAKMIVDLQDDRRIVDVNAAFELMTGYQREEVIGGNDVGLWADPAQREEAFRRIRETGRIHNFENRFRKKNGEIGAGLISVDRMNIDGRLCGIVVIIEITERVRAEEEKAKLEEQLRQAQKLESVGRLAGGVAHDFNNLLTVINGYADFLLEGLAPSNPLRSSAEEIRSAGVRAAGLTRQLLAFSRKQIMAPKVLDLNAEIRASERILQRLIGEDIGLVTELAAGLGRVMADPEQIHQVVMNLVINARDAMPHGGEVKIRTGNLEVSREEAAVDSDASPGRYVLLTVSDTGNGIDEETRRHIFEPFFTTKGQGQGTGLGLSTVYGIVRQGGGRIDVSSEPSRGTTFRVYLPRIDSGAIEETPKGPSAAGTYGSETVLVVEDLDAVRRFARTILESHGYRILEAANGQAATDVAGGYSGEIHLLLTDVVLPGINGKELSERLKTLRPGLKVLFISGYPADVIASRGVLEHGVAYLAKPFTPEQLCARIREVLGAPEASP